MNQHEWIILIIILLAGTFGGIVSYYGISGNPLRKPDPVPPNPSPPDPASPNPPPPASGGDTGKETVREPVDKSLTAPIIRGIAAAFIVPLFLNSVSSDLLKPTIMEYSQEAQRTANTADTTGKNPASAPTSPPDSSGDTSRPGDTSLPSRGIRGTDSPAAPPAPSPDGPAGNGEQGGNVSAGASSPAATASPNSRFTAYLLFAATCLLASISSRAFISSVSKSVLKLAEEANQRSKNADGKANEALDNAARNKEAITTDIPAVMAAANAGTPVGGSRSAPARHSQSFRTTGMQSAPASGYGDVYNSDPHKNRFGTLPSRDGWTLSAVVEPIGRSDLFFSVTLIVTVDDPARIITPDVTFHLHPTFPEPVRNVMLIGNRAELKVIAAGAFTVGVEVNGGVTRLELDLATLPGVPKEFAAR